MTWLTDSNTKLNKGECMNDLIPVLDILEDHLKDGCSIEQSNIDGKWCLFDDDGERICSGDSIREMLVNLIMICC